MNHRRKFVSTLCFPLNSHPVPIYGARFRSLLYQLFKTNKVDTNVPMSYLTYINHPCFMHISLFSKSQLLHRVLCTALDIWQGVSLRPPSPGPNWPSSLDSELLDHFAQLRYLPNWSTLSKHTFYTKYHVFICQVSPHISCGGACQI